MTMSTQAIDEKSKVFIVEQELKFAKCLSGNDPAKRNRILKNLKKWLKTRAKSSFAFTDGDFMRLWKGLFYCMWMSDKPLVQENLSEQLAGLVHLFDNPEISLQFFKTFLKTMSLEWFGIDQWRIDKFMMLIRRFVRQTLFVLKNNEWKDELVDLFVHAIEQTVLDTESAPLCSLTMHFNDIILEELGKVAEGDLTPETVHKFLQPFVTILARTDDYRLATNIKKSIFHNLLYQSEQGQEYQEKYEIWKKAGFPTENIDDMEVEVEYESESDDDIISDVESGAEESEQEEDEVENEEEEIVKSKKKAKKVVRSEDDDDDVDEKAEKVYDVRAGRVNVTVQEIKFDANKIVEMFNKIKYVRFANHKNKRIIKKIVSDYKQFANGIFPIGYTKMPTIKKSTKPDSQIIDDPDLCALEMEEFEQHLLSRSTKLSAKQKRKLHKMRQQELELSNGMQEEDADEEVAAKKRKTDDDSDDENLEIDESVSGPLIKFVKGGALGKVKSPKAKKRPIEQWTEEETNGDIQLSQESSGSEGEESENVNPLVNKAKKPVENKEARKINKRHSLPATTSTKSKTLSKSQNGAFSIADEWSEPIKDGETEFFVPSRKLKLKEANQSEETIVIDNNSPTSTKKPKLLKNPFAIQATTPQNKLLAKTLLPATPSSAEKRVKIMLNKNISQNRAEYMQQLKSSPQIPFDPTKKPSKGLLKPHSVPSPINPFYKKKMRASLNDTF